MQLSNLVDGQYFVGFLKTIVNACRVRNLCNVNTKKPTELTGMGAKLIKIINF